MREFRIVAAAMMAFAGVTAAGPVDAQGTILRSVQVGAALGGTIPVSSLGTAFNSGFNLTGTVGMQPAGLRFGLRFDAAYNQFGSKGASSITAKIADLSGNVVVRMAGVGVAPYAIGGVGVYHVSSSVSGSTALNRFGLNGGAGIDIPLSGLVAFIEARYNWVSENNGSTNFVPITVGLMF